MLFETKQHGGHYSFMEAWLYEHIAQPSVQRWNELLMEGPLAELPQGARVLDVGCGGGQLPVMLARARPDLLITGIDISPVQVKRALKRTAKMRERVTILEGDGMRLPFDADCFDAVISVLVLKHFAEPDLAVAQMQRVATPGALLLMAEVERGRPLDVARNFVRGMRLPWWMKPFALPMFYTFVTGQGPTKGEAEDWWLALEGLTATKVERLPELPALLLTAKRD